MTTVSVPASPRRRVSLLFGLGIAFLPIIFAWGLLRAGYSSFARTLGFGWLGLFIVAGMSMSPGSERSPPRPAAVGEAAQPADPKLVRDMVEAAELAAGPRRPRDDKPIAPTESRSIQQYGNDQRAFVTFANDSGRCMAGVMENLPLSQSRDEMIAAAKARCAGFTRLAYDAKIKAIPDSPDQRSFEEWQDGLAQDVAGRVLGPSADR